MKSQEVYDFIMKRLSAEDIRKSIDNAMNDGSLSKLIADACFSFMDKIQPSSIL